MALNFLNQRSKYKSTKTRPQLKRSFKEDEPGNFLKSQDYDQQKNNPDFNVESSSSDMQCKVSTKLQPPQSENQLSFKNLQKKPESYIERRKCLTRKSIELPSNLHLIPQCKSLKQAKFSQSIFDYTMQRLLNQTFTSEEEQNDQLNDIKQKIQQQIDQQMQTQNLNSSQVWKKKQLAKQQVLITYLGQKEDSPSDQKNEIENIDKLKFELLSRTSVTNSSKFSMNKQSVLKIDSPQLTQDSQDTCKQVFKNYAKQNTLKGPGSFAFSSIQENQQWNQTDNQQIYDEEENYKEIPEFESCNQQNNLFQRKRTNSFFQKNYNEKELDNSTVIFDQDII